MLFRSTPPNAKALNQPDQAKVLIVCAELDSLESQKKAQVFMERGIEVMAMANPFGKVDLPRLFSYLAKEREMNEIHIEAGYKLNGSMLRENCVDELLLYYAPFFMGEGIGVANVPTLATLDVPKEWEVMDQRLFGSDLRLNLVKKYIQK